MDRFSDEPNQSSMVLPPIVESKPEPPPKPCGIIVPDALIEYMDEIEGWEPLCQLVKERDAFGRKKYGQPLMSDDGRNGFEDARQEAGDLLQYTFKVFLNGDLEGLRKLSKLIQQLDDVVTSFCIAPVNLKH